jgi:hypothetical protein
MKILPALNRSHGLFAALLLFSASLAAAEPVFPGLKAILSDAEWKRAGLGRLSPDEIGVIDAALIRQQAGATARLQTDLAAAREAAANAGPALTADEKKGFLQRFGLPVFNDNDWRNMPPLKGRVVKWESANRFLLDNGQVWEGFEPITYEILNKDIEIHARPGGAFTLIVDGKNTTLRVMRLR